MADLDIKSPVGYVDKRRGRGTSNAGGTTSDRTNYFDIATMRARLQTANAAYYTSARLNSMTYNDLVHAVRLTHDATSYP